MSVDERLRVFQEALKDNTVSDIDFVRRELVHSIPYIFESDNNLYYELKSMVATRFRINPNDVTIVGSARLGFSIAPKKLWRPINDKSDIDLVVISDKVFDHFWEELHDFNINLTPRSEEEEEVYRDFLEYFFKGWLRPDMFPFTYPGKQEWFEYFHSISYRKFGYFKITCAVYRSMYFFESYHLNNIQRLRG